MKHFFKFVLLALVLAIGACSNATRFEGEGGGSVGGSGAAGTSVPADGSASDPMSSAFFQQAVGDRVLFAVGQSTLSADAEIALNAQAGWLNKNSDFRALIEGHADERGTREYNLALGARRANAVKEYLISRGVSAKRLQIVSFGKERPIEICSEESCYAKNRRAVTVLSGALTG